MIAALCAMFNANRDNEILRGTINFIVSVPAFLFSSWLDLPLILQNVLFFVYWAIIGGLLGLLLSRKKPVFKVMAVIIIAALVITHWQIKGRLEREIAGASNALEALFTGKARLEVNE